MARWTPDWLKARIVEGYCVEGLTITQLEQRTGVSRATVWRIVEAHRLATQPPATDTPVWSPDSDTPS